MESDTSQRPQTIRWSIVVVPLLVFAACVGLAIRTLVGGPTYPTFAIPGDAQVSLPEPGTYTIFCARPANVTVPVDDFRPPEIVWSVTNSRDAELAVRPYNGSLRVNDTVAIGTIDIPAAESYHFEGLTPEQSGQQYDISFRKGMFRTVATVAACVVIGLASTAFLFIYLLICVIRWLGRTSPAG